MFVYPVYIVFFRCHSCILLISCACTIPVDVNHNINHKSPEVCIFGKDTSPKNCVFQFISNSVVGLLVPIPTLYPVVKTFVPLMVHGF